MSQPQFRIRATTPDDPAFLTLIAELDAALAIVNGEQHDFYTQFSLAPTLDVVLLLEVDGEVIGCGGLRHKDARATEVKRMFVRPEFRGRGFAADVLRALEDHARAAGFAETRLETSIDLGPANRLYVREGYRQIPCFEPYVGRELSICYAKDL